MAPRRPRLSTATCGCARSTRTPPAIGLWIGKKGRVAASGLRQILERRAELAGIGHVHPHQLRHTYAHAFLAEAGNEGDVMMLAGWRSRQMLRRYAGAIAAARAQGAYRRMGIGNRLQAQPVAGTSPDVISSAGHPVC